MSKFTGFDEKEITDKLARVQTILNKKIQHEVLSKNLMIVEVE